MKTLINQNRMTWSVVMLLCIVTVAEAQTVSFKAAKDIANGSVSGLSCIDAGRINNDNLADIVAIEGGKHAGGRQTFAWFESPSNPQNSWTRRNISHSAPLRSFLGSAKLADMDGDGDLDLIVSSDNHSGGSMQADVFVFVNPGGSATGTWNHYKTNGSTMALHHINDMEIADLDGDGKPDIIVRSLEPNQIHIFFQNTISSYTHKIIDTGIAQSEGLSVGKIDGDNRIDITFTGYWLKNPSNARTGTFTQYPIDSNYKNTNQNTKESTGDIDGDGLIDIVIGPAESYRNGENHVLAWYKNPGSNYGSNWQRTVIRSNTNHHHTVKLADIDNDGDLDVITGKPWSSSGIPKESLIFYNNGSGGFGTVQTLVSGKGLYTGVVHDIGNDGDLDIVGQDSYADTSKPWFYESNQGGVSTPTAPAAPGGLSVSVAGATQINLSWSDHSSDETGFKIERKTGSGSFSQIATVGANVKTYNNTGLTANTSYTYRVRAYNSVGNSSYSNESSATTSDTAPGAPSSLAAAAVGTSQINLVWNDNAGNETGFKIERKTGSGSFSQIATVGANVKTYNNTGLTANTSYTYRVRAYNSVGDSSYSNESSATTASIPVVQGPFHGTPFGVGEVIQAEDYDHGGEGTAYHDTTSGNSGGQYRTGESVDLYASTGGGIRVGSVKAGEWLEYTVQIPSTDTYQITAAVAAPHANAKFHIEFNGQNVTGAITIPNTGDWQVFANVVVPNIDLTAGTHVMRVVMDSSGDGSSVGDFDFFRIDLDDDGIITAGAWAKLGDLPSQRVEHANAVVDGKIYVMGGLFDPNYGPSSVLAFDTAVGTWSQVSTMPSLRNHLTIGEAVWGEEIWVCGGKPDGTDKVGSKRVDIFNTRTHTWRQGPDMPDNHWAGPSVIVGHELHVLTGAVTNSTATNHHFVLDLHNQSAGWRSAKAVPQPRVHVAGVSLNNKLYLVGGEMNHTHQDGDTTTVQIYDPVTDAWDQRAPLPEARSHHECSTFAHNDKIISVSGVDSSRNPKAQATIYEYDPASDAWSQKASLPTTLASPGAKIVDGVLYVFGGGIDTWFNADRVTTWARLWDVSQLADAPPSEPTHLAAQAVSSSAIDLTWVDQAGIETGYQVQRKQGSGSFANIATLGVDVRSYHDTGLSAQTSYDYRVRALGSAANSAYTSMSSATTDAGSPPPPPSGQTPYGGVPIATGTRFEAEDFDNGGSGVAWNDSDSGNQGGQYRTNVDVDIYANSGGGHRVGRVKAGEWIEYTINVPTSGPYDITAMATSPASGGQFRIEIDGQNVSGSVNIPNTGGWQSFQNVVIQNVSLNAGIRVMRLVMVANASNGYTGDFDAFRIDADSSTPPPPPPSGQSPYGGTPIATGGWFEAEDFDNGGEDVAWNDSDSGNQGGQYRTNVNVDIYANSGGGYRVGRVFAGEWLEYTIEVSTAGTYTITANVTSPSSGGQFRIEIDGQDVSGNVNVPNTGGWQSFQNVLIDNVSLTAGTHVMRVVMVTNASNGYTGDFDAFRIDATTAPAAPLLVTGLVAHWRLDESSGTKANDDMGLHHGTLANGPAWDPGNGFIGGALNFDGSNDRVDVGAFNVSGQKLTLAAWIRRDGSGHVEGRIISKATTTSGDDHMWMLSLIETNKLRFRLNAGGTTYTLVGSAGVQVNQWHHAAATYDGTTMRLYLDGSQVASMPATGNIGTNSAAIAMGNQPAGAGDRPFGGDLDDVRVYSRTLNADDIAALAASVFIESGGVVVMEAEHYMHREPGLNGGATHSWVRVTDVPDSSNGAALEAQPNNGYSAAGTLDGERLDYDIEFQTPGTYYLWVRMVGLSGNDDSIHVGFDGLPATAGGGMSDSSGDWHWEDQSGGQRVTVQVGSPGVHTFHLWMREDGAIVDKIILTQDPNESP